MVRGGSRTPLRAGAAVVRLHDAAVKLSDGTISLFADVEEYSIPNSRGEGSVKQFLGNPSVL